MNTLQEFKFNQSGVRVVMINDDPWWVLSDVCGVLNLGNPSMISCCDNDEMRTLRITEGGPERKIVNESGLYTIIMRSNKPEAKAFRKWVTSVVLPQIRKTGSYSVQSLSRKDLALLVIKAEEELEHANTKLIAQQPKVDLAEQCLIAVNSRSVGDTAKALGVGRNTLFSFLRDESILMETNIPYQKYINAGWFEVKFAPKEQKGVVVNYPVTMVMPKGLEKIRQMLLGKEAA